MICEHQKAIVWRAAGPLPAFGLLRLLDEALRKDSEHQSRNELIESLILKYLEAKGKL